MIYEFHPVKRGFFMYVSSFTKKKILHLIYKICKSTESSCIFLDNNNETNKKWNTLYLEVFSNVHKNETFLYVKKTYIQQLDLTMLVKNVSNFKIISLCIYIPLTPTLLEIDTHNVWQCWHQVHLIIIQKEQNSHKNDHIKIFSKHVLNWLQSS